MKKNNFTKSEFLLIKKLLKERFFQTREEQKVTRNQIRKLGFYISDYFYDLTDKDFEDLLKSGDIKIIEE